MQLGKYRHYKGHYYEVLSLAQDEATKRKMVVYRALDECPDLTAEYGDRPWFTRAYDVFMEEVEYQGKVVSRFEFISLHVED